MRQRPFGIAGDLQWLPFGPILQWVSRVGCAALRAAPIRLVLVAGAVRIATTPHDLEDRVSNPSY
jgi:hypothetical protein